jgi:hypothetical protein
MFSPGQRMSFMMKMIRDGRSIKAVVIAGCNVKLEAGLTRLPAFSHAAYEEWWAKNKDTDKYKQ